MRNNRSFFSATVGAGTYLAIACVHATGVAEEPASAIRWSDIVRLIDRHPRIGATRAQVDAAQGNVVAAGQVPNPSVEGGLGKGFATETGAQRWEWGVSLSIPLEWLAVRGHQIDAASADLESTRQESLAARLEVLQELRDLFLSVARDQALGEALAETEKQTAQLLDLVKKRVELGEARPAEVPRVEIEVEKVRIELGAVRAQARIKRAKLGIWLPGLTGTDLGVATDLSAIPPLPDFQRLAARVRSEHPAVRAAMSRVAARAAEVDAEKNRRLPGVTLKARHERELDRAAYGGELAIEIPIWNWNTGRIDQARAIKAAEENKADVATAALLASVTEAYVVCERGRDVAGRYADAILPLAKRSVEAVEKSFAQGEVSLLEVLDARRVHGEARRDALAASFQANVDCSRLHIITGEEIL